MKRQDAEQDRDIANLLEFDIGGRLDGALGRTRALIVSLETRPTDRLPEAPEEDGDGPTY